MDTAAISPSRLLSLACTTVGCGPGGSTSMLARVVLVNFRGATVFDSYVAPTMPVSDYRTGLTGLLPGHLAGAPDFATVQQLVAGAVRGHVLVGHALWHDLSGGAPTRYVTCCAY